MYLYVCMQIIAKSINYMYVHYKTIHSKAHVIIQKSSFKLHANIQKKKKKKKKKKRLFQSI